ncbi:DNRLRE domain-containing protein [Clostridium sp. JN-1]|uniref:DNRLRE domain-containing protein n=1 Tax=Clostridium sp. JN-1 TaxID=2483110 RepID=UPI0016815687|nr:DNRLRE domain-containing protein [Clostridium sp. JN-1]
MLNYKMQFSCSRSLTITDLYPNRNFQKGVLNAGFYEGNLYKSYIYFDLSNLCENFIVNSAVLRLYLKKHISYGKKSNLYIYPLKESFNKCTAFTNQPGISNEFVKFSARDYNRPLDIDITSLFNSNNINYILNNGILLKCDEDKNSLVSFYSNLTDNCKIVPKIFLDYSCDECSQNKKKYVDVKKKSWLLNFSNEVVTQPVNVERLIQGTFFINNLSSNTLKARVEVSFDLNRWIKDQEVDIAQNSNGVLVAQYYGRYYRIVVNSPDNNGKVEIKFVYQVYV